MSRNSGKFRENLIFEDRSPIVEKVSARSLLKNIGTVGKMLAADEGIKCCGVYHPNVTSEMRARRSGASRPTSAACLGLGGRGIDVDGDAGQVVQFTRASHKVEYMRRVSGAARV